MGSQNSILDQPMASCIRDKSFVSTNKLIYTSYGDGSSIIDTDAPKTSSPYGIVLTEIPIGTTLTVDDVIDIKHLENGESKKVILKFTHPHTGVIIRANAHIIYKGLFYEDHDRIQYNREYLRT